MKKLLTLGVVAALFFAACKGKTDEAETSMEDTTMSTPAVEETAPTADSTAVSADSAAMKNAPAH